jgi:hypothetical protein
MARRTCTSLSFASLLLLTASPARAECAADEAALFFCMARDKAHSIELCAVRDDAAGGFQSLQYRYGTAETEELVFPSDRREGKAAMAFAHAHDGENYVWSLRFTNTGYTYRIFGLGTGAGVEVWRKKKRLAQVMCEGEPQARVSDMRRAASCDMSNPFGRLGCAEVPPRRK